MRNFKNFKKEYEALLASRADVLKISVRFVKPYYEDQFYESRRKFINQISTAIDLLEERFCDGFPDTSLKAFWIKDFSYDEFFDFLKHYPKLAKRNEQALRSLLEDLKAGSQTGLPMTRVPDISEFIPA